MHNRKFAQPLGAKSTINLQVIYSKSYNITALHTDELSWPILWGVTTLATWLEIVT